MNETVARSGVFQELGQDGRDLLQGFLESRSYEPGFQIFGVNQEAQELLVVASGGVVLRLRGEAVGRVGPGEMLGGMSLVLIGRRQCEALADGETEILSLTRERYLRLRADHPRLALQVQEGVLRSVAAALRGLLPDGGAAD